MTRKGLYQQDLIPFPTKLMNTSVSPNLLNTEWARKLVNMIPSTNKSGTGQKRFGLVPQGISIGAGVITQLMEYVKDEGTQQILAYTNDGKIHLTEDFGATWLEVRTGLNTDGVVRYAYLQRKLIIVNGQDDNIFWDGSVFTDLSQDVQEQLKKDWVDETSFTVGTEDDLAARYASTDEIDITFRAKDIEISTITRVGTVATVTCANNANLEVGDTVNITNTDPEEYEGLHTVVTASGAVFTIEVDASFAAAASAPANGIKLVKGESIPITELTEISPVPDTLLRNGNVELEFTSPYPIAGIDALVSKRPAGGPDHMEAELFYKKASETEWILARNITKIGGADKQPFEITGLASDIYNFKLVGNITSRFVRVQELSWHKVTSGTVLSAGNRLRKEHVVHVSSITRVTNTATVTTATGHGLIIGDAVTVFAAEQEDYNITAIVASAPSDTTFTYEVANDPVTPATPDPDLAATMEMDINTAKRTTTIASSSFATPLHTVVLTDAVLPDSGKVEIRDVTYQDAPQPFSFIYSKHDRLWALSGGESKATTFRPADRLTVFYTTERDVITSFISPDTQATAFIDTQNKHNIEDEFVAISSISGSLVFHGRERTQVWLGQDPTEDGDLSWAKNINIGTVHGDLVQELPDDVLFVSDYGVRQLSVAFQTEELEIAGTIGEAVDPTIEDMVRSLRESDSNYRAASSFAYQTNGLYGFKAGGQMLIYIISEKSRGWVFFDSKFLESTAFLALTDGRLFTGRNDILGRYANGVLGAAKEYADFTEPYTTIWFTPWIERQGRKFNQYWQFINDINEETAPFALQFARYKNNDAASQVIQDVVVGKDISFWDEAQWDVGEWDSAFARPLLRDQFKAESYAFSIISNNTTGGLNIVAVNSLGA